MAATKRTTSTMMMQSVAIHCRTGPWKADKTEMAPKDKALQAIPQKPPQRNQEGHCIGPSLLQCEFCAIRLPACSRFPFMSNPLFVRPRI